MKESFSFVFDLHFALTAYGGGGERNLYLP